MNVAEIFRVEEGTASILIDENAVTVPVQGHGITETLAYGAFCLLVEPLGFRVDDDLPARAAGIRAVPGQASEGIEEFGCLKIHGILLLV